MRIVLVILILCLPSIAAADVVGPEPESCPAGSSPSVSHSGPYCRPTAECTSEASCGASQTCGAVMQCVETRGCGGLMPPDAEPCTLEHVVGPCDGDGSCDVGVCRARDLCSGEGGSGGDDGCGCRAVAPQEAGWPAMALAALAWGTWRRRR